MIDLFAKALENTDGDKPAEGVQTNIPPTYMMMKLSSGETIIAKVIGEPSNEPEKLMVEDPFEIKTVHQPIEGGTRSTTFYAEWFLSCETRLYLIAKSHIVSASAPNAAARAEYNNLVAKKNIAQASTPPLQKAPQTAAIMGAPSAPPKKDWSIVSVDGHDRFKHS